MKKFTVLFLTIAITGTAAFALPVFNKENDKETAKKVEAVLERNKAAAQAQQVAVTKALKATVLKGYFIPGFLRVKEFKGKNFNVNFFIDKAQNSNSGNMAFTITANENILKNISVNILPEYLEGVNGDPDTEIELNLEVKVKNPLTAQEEVTTVKRFTTVTLNDLRKGDFTDMPTLEKVTK